MRTTPLRFFPLLLALALPGFILAQYDIPASVIGSGGGTVASGTYSLSGTLGQIAVSGTMSSANYNHDPGFQPMAKALTVVPLADLYTIGTGEVYPTFNDAVNDLIAGGISGPVTFQVKEGTYTESITIGLISGVSAVNTIIFEPHPANTGDVILQPLDPSANNWVVKLDGAQRITIKGMRFEATHNDNSCLIHLTGDADHINLIDNDFIGLTPTLTATASALVYGDNDATWFTADSLIIKGNNFEKGSYGVYLFGYFLNMLTDTEILGNTFTEQVHTSVFLDKLDGPVINENTISSVTGTAMTGINLSDCVNDIEVSGNLIDLAQGGRGISGAGIIGTVIEKILIANNRISVGGSSAAAGIWLEGNWDHMQILHNTVHVSSIHLFNGIGLYINPLVSNLAMHNNIIANTGGGVAIYHSGAAPPNTTSSYNDLYATGTNLITWMGFVYGDLASFQVANATLGINSISADPVFLDEANGDYRLRDDSPAIGAGDPAMDAPPFDYDITGVSRPLPAGSNPDLGAYENALGTQGVYDEPPAAPTGLIATAGDGAVNLIWTANDEADLSHYLVYQGTATIIDTTSKGIVTVTQPAIIYTVPNLSNGTAYFFQIYAVDDAGNVSGVSNEVSATPAVDADVTPPEAPTGLIATAGAAEVNLSWTANGEGDLSHYVVYQSITDGFIPAASDSIAMVLKPGTGYISTSLTNGTAYYYNLAAVDNSGNYSAVSAQVSAVPQIADPDITIEAITGDGNVTFAGVGVDMDFTFTNDAGSDVVQAHVFNAAPTGTIPVTVALLGGRYWQFDHTGSSTFSVDLKLNVGAGILTAADIANPGLIKLLRRGDSSTPDWVIVASGALVADSSVTFTGLAGFSQYAVARFVPDEVAPDVSPPVASDSPSSGSSIYITSTVSDDRALLSVHMFYMAGGDPSFTQVAMTDLGGGSYTAIIPGTAVSENGVAFYVKAIDTSTNETVSDTVSASINFITGTLASNNAGSAYPAGIPQEKWRLISLPGNITNRTSAAIIGTPMGFSPSDTSWNLYQYTGTGSPPYQPATTLEKGESYFFKQVRLSTVDFIAGLGSSVDVTGYSITVPAQSWKFFSSPYAFPVTAIDDASFDGAYRYGPYGDGGTEGWSTAQPVTIYEPWGGYIVYNTTAQSQELGIRPASLPKAIAKSAPEQIDGWLLRLIATGDKYFDDGNVIGRLAGASDDLDKYDHPEFPAIDGFVQVTIDRDDWIGDVSHTRDIRSMGEGDGTWDLLLASRGDGGEIRWRYDITGNPPETIAMMDIVSREVYYLSDGQTPDNSSIMSEEIEVRLKVFAGSKRYVEQAIDETIAALPSEFALHQNYPNPFNPTTKLSFSLARPGEIRLSVYNLLGQEVTTVAEGLWDMGDHTVEWSGRDQAGRRLPSGIYIAVMQAEGRLHARKMVLLK